MPEACPHAAQAIETVSRALAEWIVCRQYERSPALADRYGKHGHRMWRTDVEARLRQLAQAVGVGRCELFADGTAWSKVAFAARNVAVDDLRLSLECMIEVLGEHLPPAVAAPAVACVKRAMVRLDEMPTTVPSAIDPHAPFGDVARRYLGLMLESKREEAIETVLDAMRAGASFEQVCLRILRPAMCEVGRLWHLDELSVAEEHYCTAATGVALGRTFALARAANPPVPNDRIALVTAVGGDLHELGARMVSDFLELTGWHCVFLGANTPTDDVIAAATAHDADLLAISANTIPAVGTAKELIAELRANDGLAGLRVLVGGAPFGAVAELWREVGADGWARDAGDAVNVAAKLVGLRTAGD